MTTKAEFDAFIAGFKLAGHDHLDMAQLDAILEKVDNLWASTAAVAVAMEAAQKANEPALIDSAVHDVPVADPAPIEQVTESLPDPAPVAEAPAPVDTAEPAQVTETTVDPAPVAETVAGDAQQAVTDADPNEPTQP